MKKKLLLIFIIMTLLFTASCSSQFKIKFSQGTTTTTTLAMTESLLPNDQDLKSGFYSIEELDQITALHREDPNVCNLDSHLHLSQDTLQKIVASLGVQLQDNFVQCRFESYILNVSSNA